MGYNAERRVKEGRRRQRMAVLKEVRLRSHALIRGGTAPAPPETEDAFLQTRGPSSSYKYSVQNMGASPDPVSHVNHVSIRPAGYSSKPQSRPGLSYMKATESSQHKTTAVKALPFSDLGMKRPEQKQFYPELADIKRPLVSRMKADDMTRPPCRGEDPATNGVRPPSRQTHLHSSIGLDLPPRPITPPDNQQTEDPFDKTWSYSLRGQVTTTNEKTRTSTKGNTLLDAKRQRWEGEEKPRFAVKAWEEDSKAKKSRAVTAVEMFPSPQAPEPRKTAPHRPASGAVRGQEIPIIVTHSMDRKETDLLPKRRIQSAALYVPRNPTGAAKDKFPFKSSLGQDFLGLFE